MAGILDVYAVMLDEAGQPPARHATEPLIMPAETTVTDALYQMQRRPAAMAVVADSEGVHVGIATVKDLVEEIVGELEAW